VIKMKVFKFLINNKKITKIVTTTKYYITNCTDFVPYI